MRYKEGWGIAGVSEFPASLGIIVDDGPVERTGDWVHGGALNLFQVEMVQVSMSRWEPGMGLGRGTFFQRGLMPSSGEHEVDVPRMWNLTPSIFLWNRGRDPRLAPQSSVPAQTPVFRESPPLTVT